MQGRLRQSVPGSWSRFAADDQGSLTMTGKLFGSAKKNLPYHNTLILHKSKKQTVKDQPSGLTEVNLKQ